MAKKTTRKPGSKPGPKRAAQRAAPSRAPKRAAPVNLPEDAAELPPPDAIEPANDFPSMKCGSPRPKFHRRPMKAAAGSASAEIAKAVKRM